MEDGVEDGVEAGVGGGVSFNPMKENETAEADMADVSMIKRQAIFMLTNVVVADANRFYYEDY